MRTQQKKRNTKKFRKSIKIKEMKTLQQKQNSRRIRKPFDIIEMNQINGGENKERLYPIGKDYKYYSLCGLNIPNGYGHFDKNGTNNRIVYNGRVWVNDDRFCNTSDELIEMSWFIPTNMLEEHEIRTEEGLSKIEDLLFKFCYRTTLPIYLEVFESDPHDLYLFDEDENQEMIKNMEKIYYSKIEKDLDIDEIERFRDSIPFYFLNIP